MTPGARLRRIGVVLCVALGCGPGCRADNDPPADTGRMSAPALHQAPLPDLSRLDPALQEQFRTQHEALASPAAAFTDAAERYARLGTLLLAAEYPEAAMPYFENARILDDRDFRWPYYLGHAHRAAHALEGAAASFSEALRREPDHVPSLVWLGDTYLALGRPGAAEVPLARAVELDPSSLAAWFRRGQAALAAGDHVRAVDYLERARSLNEGADAVHYQLGLAYRALGQTARADAHLRRRADAATILPADPLMDSLPGLLQTGNAHLVRGLDAMDRRDWAAAVDHLRTASQLSPDDGVVHLNLATALFLWGDSPGARRAAEQAVRLAPDLPKAHYTLGLLAEAVGRDAEAIDRFTAAVGLDARYLEAHASLADALRRTGRVEASLAHYTQVLALDPAASQARFGYAMALVRLERYRDARAWLREAAALHPDQPGFTHALARILAAAPDAGVRNGREALEMVERLRETQRSPTLDETWAMALAELGRFADAVRVQEAAIDAFRQAGQMDAANRLQANLTLYRRGEPSRTPWSADDPIHAPRPSS